jgi:plasmid rolling circle replication initiator protein Rep
MKLDILKTQSLEACQSLAQIESEVTHAGRQFRCAEFLHYALEPGTLKLALNRANFCKQRTCPVCTWLKSTKLRIRIFHGLPRLLADYPTARFLLLTLTIKNCHYRQLRSQVGEMKKGWKRLCEQSRFPAIGYLKTLEISRPRDYFYHGIYVGRFGHSLAERWVEHLRQTPTWNPQAWRSYTCEEVHPHYHALLMVNSSYEESEPEYIKQAEWRFLWQRAARLEYLPVVDVRTVKNLYGSIFETTKYCLKTTDMVDVLGCLAIRQLHGLRLTSIGGAFNDYFSQAALDAIAATGELGNETWQQGLPCWYEWDGEEYSLTRLAHVEWGAG